MFVSLARLCILYVVKEIASFPGSWLSNGRGVKERVFELHTSQKASERM